jgi:hypothetical protein
VDPSGRWTAALKTALGDFPGEILNWHPAANSVGADLAAKELVSILQSPSKPCGLVIYHCSTDNLHFLEVWPEASRVSLLPPLIGLLDSTEPELGERLREIGCAQVYAGLHTLERLVKTVKSIPAPSVYLDSHLEEWIAANLPWNS